MNAGGQTLSWVVYTYGRTFSHINKQFNILVVNRFVSATLKFDASQALVSSSLSRFQSYVTNAVNREATEAEVAQYLGAPETLDLKVDVPASAPSKPVASPDGWKLGMDISELRSEYIAATGYAGRGVYVVSVLPDGLAGKAGLRAGDVLVSLNGAATPTREDLVDRLKTAPVTLPLVFEVFRQGTSHTVSIPAQSPAESVLSI